jgi:hypothetical protein
VDVNLGEGALWRSMAKSAVGGRQEIFVNFQSFELNAQLFELNVLFFMSYTYIIMTDEQELDGKEVLSLASALDNAQGKSVDVKQLTMQMQTLLNSVTEGNADISDVADQVVSLATSIKDAKSGGNDVKQLTLQMQSLIDAVKDDKFEILDVRDAIRMLNPMMDAARKFTDLRGSQKKILVIRSIKYFIKQCAIPDTLKTGIITMVDIIIPTMIDEMHNVRKEAIKVYEATKKCCKKMWK